MDKPKVSVVVPIYKVEKYLVQCIDSILNQTLKDIEVILVDEGDIDACRFIIDHYEQTDNRVKTLHEKNGGYGASVNKAFDIATGEYISIIESDDFIESTMYEELYNYAKKLDADVVKVPYFEYWEKTSHSAEKCQLCFWYAKTKDLPENKLFKIEDYPVLVAIHPSIWSAFYKTSYIKEKNIRCIEARGAGYVDNHFRIQTLCQTDKIAWLNKPFNYYRLSNPDASQANCDLGAFIQRWDDVHKLFDEKFPQKWEILAPYCIQEEWANTFLQVMCHGYKLTEEQYEILANNFSYTSKEQIAKSTELARGKKFLLRLKKNPELLKNYIDASENNQAPGYITKFKIRIFGIPLLKIKEKQNRKWRVLLFGFLPIITIKR